MTPAPSNPLTPGRATLLLAGLVSIMPFAIDAYLPALGAMATDLGTTVHRLERSVGSFFLGTALGQLIGAPFSDRHGRKLPISLGLLIFIAASVIIAVTSTDTGLIVWRFVQAFGAGVAVVNGAAIARDLFDELESARLFANIAVVMMIAPMVSPLVGAYLLEGFGWPSIFVFLAAYGTVVAALLFFALPETRFLRKSPIATHGYRHVLSSGWNNLFAISLAFSSTGFFLYLADSSFIFLEFYGLSPTAFAWLFGLGVVMLIGAHRVNRRLLVHFRPRRLLVYCFPLQALGSLLILAYVLIGPGNMWLMFVLIMVTAGITQIISSNGLAAYLALNPDHTGKANAILGSLRFGMGGAFGFLLSATHTKSLLTFGLLSFLTASVALALFAVCRARSDIFVRLHTH